MDWSRLQTYGLSPNKSFEMICNQLFENWCKDEYKSSLKAFYVVNGAGGDGGVESYATLIDDTIIGLQAKWFLNTIDSSQISQIKGSVETAMKIRPAIKRYIVCVPRDFASVTGRSNNTESKRLTDLLIQMKDKYPELTIDLWDDTRITSELQKPCAEGIHRFWFTNSEIAWDNIGYAFSKATASWLSTKYVPDLNVVGQIDSVLSNYIGDYSSRNKLYSVFSKSIDLCNQFGKISNELLSVVKNQSKEIKSVILDAKRKIISIKTESIKILNWLENEYAENLNYDESVFEISFDSIVSEIRNCKLSYSYTFHIYEVKKVLEQFSEIDYYNILKEVESASNKQCIVFLGEPGTGKTQGVASFTEEQIKKQYHIPILVQARGILDDYNWREIILHVLGLADVWNEEELWQGLISAANRSRFKKEILAQSIKVLPKVLIIVDGIDESSSHQRWIERIKESSSITEKYPQIRFCFTSRPIVFERRINYANVKHLSSKGDTPVFKLFDTYINAYGIKVQNCQWLKYALNSPLALKLFCELYRGQTITLTDISQMTMEQLWRSKIERIQTEYNSKMNLSDRNQYIISSIVSISKCFIDTNKVDRDTLVSGVEKRTSVSHQKAENILDFLEAYGVVGSFCEKGTALQPDRYIYYPGIQGYFDYAISIMLIKEYEHPSKIDFANNRNITLNTLYCLSVISIQKYKYLLTRNTTILSAIGSFQFEEVMFYALQHSAPELALSFKERALEIMRNGAEDLVKVTNKLVLPLARINSHPLGISLLDEMLRGFEKPAQRDIVWSLPPFLQGSANKKWYKQEEIDLMRDYAGEYELTSEDRYDGLPTVYVWMLSNVDNTIRMKCRDQLMMWAKKIPRQYYKLFLHFSDINDPQIRSDLFSILMCLVYEGNEKDLVKEISDWILNNILSPSKINQNRDVFVRYYSIAIIRKAIMVDIYAEDEVMAYLPPYNAENIEIELKKEALSGTRMEGYSAISYDLARYVLCDHFDYAFNGYSYRELDSLCNSISKNDPEFTGLNSEKFIISAAYAFLLQMGWNEEEFYNLNLDACGKYIGGIDLTLGSSPYIATHGAKSKVMTVCEKYIWAARAFISGFLSDRLLLGDNRIQVTDYSSLEDISIPNQGIILVDPYNITDYVSWYIPECESVLNYKTFSTTELISEYIQTASEIDWEKWILIKNREKIYSIPKSELLALKMTACFSKNSDVETCLFLNSVIVPNDKLSVFLNSLREEAVFDAVNDPERWCGYLETSCYLSPKEACWFSWKDHYNTEYAEEFPDIIVDSTVDCCTYNSPQDQEIQYYLPSPKFRRILGIVDTDGHLYFDNEKNALAEYSCIGERLGDLQEYVLVGSNNILDELQKSGLSLVWIMEELREETSKAKEKHGNFFSERRQYYIGYFLNGKFITEKVKSVFNSSKIVQNKN